MMEQMTNSMSSSDETEIRDTFKLISYLLQYPDKKWFQWRELLEEVQQFENSDVKASLLSFLLAIEGISLDNIQKQYVELFDFNPSCTLSMSYLKAGEQRERGQILVELKALYKEYGFEMTEDELSDYLPVVLEFVSLAPFRVSVNLLRSFSESIGKLKSELEIRKTPYAFLLDACISGATLLEEITL